MKFGQLMEYNMRNIFLEKSCAKGCEKTSLTPFHKNSKPSIYLDQQSEDSCSLFFVRVQVENYQNILKIRCWPIALIYLRLFQKTKRGLELVSLSRFLHGLWRIIYLTLYCINWPNFIWSPLFFEISVVMFIAIVFDPVCDWIFWHKFLESVVQKCCIKKVFLEIS